MFQQASIELLRAMPRGLVKRVASRYLAGENQQDAIRLALDYNSAGVETTLDMLGEDVSSLAEARAATRGYIDLVATMSATAISRNISIKLTQLGLRLDEAAAFDNLTQLLTVARQHNFFVRLDMEDTSVTDLTIDFYRRARSLWPRVGTVLQARLLRTRSDAEILAAEGANIRLVKGIYPERAAVAYQESGAISHSFLEVLKILLAGDTYVAIATHDLALLAQAENLIERERQDAADIEFQALLGVPIRSTLVRLRAAGNTVRLYLPYGRDWHAYSMRRLGENPKIAMDIVKGLFRSDRTDPASLKKKIGGSPLAEGTPIRPP